MPVDSIKEMPQTTQGQLLAISIMAYIPTLTETLHWVAVLSTTREGRRCPSRAEAARPRRAASSSLHIPTKRLLDVQFHFSSATDRANPVGRPKNIKFRVRFYSAIGSSLDVWRDRSSSGGIRGQPAIWHRNIDRG